MGQRFPLGLIHSRLNINHSSRQKSEPCQFGFYVETKSFTAKQGYEWSLRAMFKVIDKKEISTHLKITIIVSVLYYLISWSYTVPLRATQTYMDLPPKHKLHTMSQFMHLLNLTAVFLFLGCHLTLPDAWYAHKACFQSPCIEVPLYLFTVCLYVCVVLGE